MKASKRNHGTRKHWILAFFDLKKTHDTTITVKENTDLQSLIIIDITGILLGQVYKKYFAGSRYVFWTKNIDPGKNKKDSWSKEAQDKS